MGYIVLVVLLIAVCMRDIRILCIRGVKRIFIKGYAKGYNDKNGLWHTPRYIDEERGYLGKDHVDGWDDL